MKPWPGMGIEVCMGMGPDMGMQPYSSSSGGASIAMEPEAGPTGWPIMLCPAATAAAAAAAAASCAAAWCQGVGPALGGPGGGCMNPPAAKCCCCCKDTGGTAAPAPGWGPAERPC